VPLDIGYIGILGQITKSRGNKILALTANRLGAYAVAVKKCFLCPESYAMPQGVLKYIFVNANTLDDHVPRQCNTFNCTE